MTSKVVLPHSNYFLQIKIEFEDGSASSSSSSSSSPVAVPLSALRVKTIVQEAVRSMLGEVGLGRFDADVLGVDGDTAILAIQDSDGGVVAFRAALSLLGRFDSRACRIRVLRQSPHLIALAAPR